LYGFVVGAPETREDAQTSLQDLEQKIRAFEARFPRTELETGIGASGREWGRLYTKYQNLVSYMVHRGWQTEIETGLKAVVSDREGPGSRPGPGVLRLSASGDTARAKSRTEKLQHFEEVERRLYDLKKLYPLWAHAGFLVGDDKAPEYVIQVRELTKERDAAIQNLQQSGITPQESETISAQLRENWDVSRNLELAQLAGISTTSTIAKPAEPQQQSRTASSEKTSKRARRRKKRELTTRPDTTRGKSRTPARRLTATIESPTAARRMEAYLTSNGIGQTEFANQVGTTDRTLRAFRKRGKVRRDIFEAIAEAMGTTKEALLKIQ
jgi:hypothetical protein